MRRRASVQVGNTNTTAKYQHARGKIATFDRLTTDDWIAIRDRTGGVCGYCGMDVGLYALTIDHVMPMSRGGLNRPDNIAAACWPCNYTKRAKV